MPPSRAVSLFSPGRPGETFFLRALGLFGRCEPPRGACGASRHLRSSSVLVEGSDGSRRRDQLRVARLLTVKASAPSHHGAARGSLTGIHRRPPTSCAHRLRKPDHACELLAPSVAPRIRWARAPIPRLRAPCRVVPLDRFGPCGTPRPRDLRCARFAATTAGLER
jgi:hypothetical protein